jgi:hypothetical protein
MGRIEVTGSGTPAVASAATEIVQIDRVEIAVEPWAWRFAVERREEIERHFARIQRERPAVWNGRLLLLHRCAVENGVLRGACFETDYANFCAWRDWNLPDANVFNIFAVAALRTGDGAYLVGEMASDTAAAGALYFPCGTPDCSDLGAGGVLDLAASVRRELLEETGLDIDTLAAEPGWRLVRDRGFLALMKPVTARQNAQALRAHIMRYLANDAQPEFCDIRIVRGVADFDPAMPPFVMAYLTNVWS